MKTLLLALISPAKSKGTREGSIRGLIGVGKEAVRKGLIEGGGAKVIGSECGPGERSPLVDAVIDAFKVLQPPSDMPETATPDVMEQLNEVLGEYFAAYLSGDQTWSLGVLTGTIES